MGNTRRPPSLGLALPSSSDPSACPCGSGVSLRECCGPIHGDPTRAATAEQLMRARYSAYALGRRPFLEASWHSTTRPDHIGVDDDTEWIGLTITETVAGGPNDDRGEVAFVARLREGSSGDRSEQRLVEHSRFVREGGHWVYLDAVT